MARKRKVTPHTSPEAETSGPITTPVEAAPPSGGPEPAAHPDPAVAVTDATPGAEPTRGRQPDPHGVMTVALTDESDGPKARLFRSNRWQQMAVTFDEKPAPEIIEQLRDAGFRWRGEEKAWTVQLDKERRWQTHAEAEALFKKLTDEIRAANGCTGQAVG